VKVPFKYYLHDDANTAERQYEFSQKMPDVEFTDELMEKIGRPFYEIELSCLLDTKTGEVTIIGVMP
jgi:hypothetical protein